MELYSFEELQDKRLGKIGMPERDAFEKEVAEAVKAKIAKAREEIRNGQCVTLKSHEDVDKYFASL